MARPWSLDELAEASGEATDRVRAYVDMGLLRRQPDGEFEPGSLHRLRLIRFARSRGIDDEQLAAVTASQGDLLGMFEELVPHADATVDLFATARELGIDDAVADELGELLEWRDLEAGTEADVDALRVVARALSLGMPHDALLQVVRVLVDATDRLSDGVVRTFHNYVHERFRAEGLAGPELLEVSRRVGRPLVDLLEPAIIYFHRRAYHRANREDLLRHLAEHVNPPSATLGEEEVTVLFVDLASFTPLTVAMGDQAAADVLRRFGIAVRSNATRHGGRILKQIGDAFMLVFGQPVGAVEFGLAMDDFVGTEPQFPALHMGAHHGTLLYREGDYVGRTVNLAARVASAGSAGQFLITEELLDAVSGMVDADFSSLPPRRLKGISNPIALAEVRRRTSARTDRLTDPVCGMLLFPDDVVFRTNWRAKTFAFCSEMCQRAFVEDPGHFTAAQPH